MLSSLLALVGFLPGGKTASSLVWALGGICGGVVLAVSVWTLHTPSGRVVSAVAAEHAKGEARRLRDANASLASEIKALNEAAVAGSRRIKDREIEMDRISAELLKKDEENAALRAKAPDPNDVVFSSSDDWFMRRRSKTGTDGGAGDRRSDRAPLPGRLK